MAPHESRSLPKVIMLCRSPGNSPGLCLSRRKQRESLHPAARLRSVTARCVLSHCARALLSGTRRGRQFAAVFFWLLMSGVISPKPYGASGTAIPCMLPLHHPKPGDVISDLHGCGTHKEHSSICSSPSTSLSPQELSWVAGKALLSFQLFRSGSPLLL